MGGETVALRPVQEVPAGARGEDIGVLLQVVCVVRLLLEGVEHHRADQAARKVDVSRSAGSVKLSAPFERELRVTLGQPLGLHFSVPFAIGSPSALHKLGVKHHGRRARQLGAPVPELHADR